MHTHLTRVEDGLASPRVAARIGGLVLLVVPMLVGCGSDGPQTYHVTGIVTYQGKPLPLGTIMFVPQGAPPSQPTEIGPDGRYELDAVAGSHAVMIVAVPVTSGRVDPEVEGGIDYTDAEPVESLIPEKYNRYETSGVTVLVAAKKRNEIDIPLD